jgi:LuxR family maltose regulon positive regulatory protein
VLEVAIRVSDNVLAATKTHIPRIRPGLVARRELVDELIASRSRKAVLIEAPAGYGKTTLLAQWCASPEEDRDFAWLTIDREDRDPVRFLAGIIAAIRTVEPGFGKAAADALGTRNLRWMDVVLPLLLDELVAPRREVVLVLDDYQTVIKGQEVHDTVSFLLDHLPPGLQLAVASRADPPLPLARLRAAGEVTEIRARDLRFGDKEARQLLLAAVGYELAEKAVTRLCERTEGWPAGLYLAGLSLRGREDVEGAIDSFAGNDRNIVDYLSSEVLAGQPERIRRFLLQTSILERLCGSLCDTVARTQGSARLLEQIERQNLFLVPLDNTRTWYRYHRLFREVLRHELRLTDPKEIVELQRRAAEWHREQGSLSEAIHHTTAAGNPDQAADLIAANWNDFFNQGRLGTVEGWLHLVPQNEVIRDPRLCVAHAWLALDRGRLEDAGVWVERATSAAVRVDRDAAEEGIEAEIRVLRAVQGFKVGELERARTAAREVLESAPDGSFSATVAQIVLAVTLYWGGELDEARTACSRAVHMARSSGNDLGHAYALGYLAMIEADEGRATGADRLGAQAVGLSDAPGFTEHFVTAIGNLARGRADLLQGRLDDAAVKIQHAVDVSQGGAGRLEMAAPLIALSHVRHLQGEPDAGKGLLGEARAIIDRSGEPGLLATALRVAERSLGIAYQASAGRSSVPVEALTDRELAVLRMLNSQLSLREIGTTLEVSLNTIKTHAKSVYRKLDVSSRSDAVGRARELGFL